MRYHLAILQNPWYNAVLTGFKTIESRWYKRKTFPYEDQEPSPDKKAIKHTELGDVLLLKRSGYQWVTYGAEIKAIGFIEGEMAWEELKRLKKQLYIDDAYIAAGIDAQKMYLALFYLKPVQKLTHPFTFKQEGQKSWFYDYKYEHGLLPPVI
jgi:hypothetical protein